MAELAERYRVIERNETLSSYLSGNEIEIGTYCQFEVALLNYQRWLEKYPDAQTMSVFDMEIHQTVYCNGVDLREELAALSQEEQLFLARKKEQERESAK